MIATCHPPVYLDGVYISLFRDRKTATPKLASSQSPHFRKLLQCASISYVIAVGMVPLGGTGSAAGYDWCRASPLPPPPPQQNNKKAGWMNNQNTIQNPSELPPTSGTPMRKSYPGKHSTRHLCASTGKGSGSGSPVGEFLRRITSSRDMCSQDGGRREQ